MKDEALTIFRRRNIGFIFQAFNLIPEQYRSMFIYVTISVGVIFAIYTMFSKKFNSEVKVQIDRIKADKTKFGMSENVS